MKVLKTGLKLEVRTSTIPNAGLGVFATADIEEGEILEECHFIELAEIDYDNIDPVLKDYVFCFPFGAKNQCLPLGYGCIYNHSEFNNAYWECDVENRVFRFIAKRPIKKLEEIFTNYLKLWK
jgi:hypothetical protein